MKQLKNKGKSNFKIDSKTLIIYFMLFIALVILTTPKEVVQDAGIVGAVLAKVFVIGGYIPPTFDHDLENFTINQSDTFSYDINCSDIEPLDVIRYYDNFTGFEINESTGLIYQEGFDEIYLGNNTINITCSDGNATVSDTFVLYIIDDNSPPTLLPIGPQIAVENQLFELYIYATDPDFDNMTFIDSTTLFDITVVNTSSFYTTGLIKFVPTLDQVGNYTINISVFDGIFTVSEVISFTIVRGPYCGDDSCNNNETCETCAIDCGECPPPDEDEQEEQDTEGEGEGGAQEKKTGIPPQFSGGTARPAYQQCVEKWECSDWSICTIDGYRTRKCKDVNQCETEKKKPDEIEECEYIPTCFDGVQNGDEEGIDCGGPCEPCLIPNCFDGIQNCHGGKCEEGIDCGGPCEPCEVPAKEPIIEQPVMIIPKHFPWLLLLIIAILLASTITGDQVYVRKIKEKNLEEYKELMRKYRPTRRKIYKFVINTVVITLIAAFYIYYFSDNLRNMIKFSWIPILIIIIMPFVVSIVIRKLSYYEYQRRKKEERLKHTHKRQLLQLIKVENELLYGLENKLRKKTYKMTMEHKFDSSPQFYKEISPTYGILTDLSKKRKERIRILKLSSEVISNALTLTEDNILIEAAKEYPEFMSIKRILRFVIENNDIDTSDQEEEFIFDVKEVSKPYMKSIILADKKLIRLYNRIVEVYEYYQKKNNDLKNKDKEIQEIEKSFIEKIKGIAKKSEVIAIVEQKKELVPLYNNLIDLFNHYTRKMQLSSSLKER